MKSGEVNNWKLKNWRTIYYILYRETFDISDCIYLLAFAILFFKLSSDLNCSIFDSSVPLLSRGIELQFWNIDFEFEIECLKFGKLKNWSIRWVSWRIAGLNNGCPSPLDVSVLLSISVMISMESSKASCNGRALQLFSFPMFIIRSVQGFWICNLPV